jgi:hypothetical protein
MRKGPAVEPCPDLASLVARLASHHDLDTVINSGAWWPPELELLYPALRVVAAGQRGLSHIDPGRSAILVDAALARAADLTRTIDSLRRLVDRVPVLVVATEEIDGLTTTLATIGIEPAFVGQTRAVSGPSDRRVGLVIVDRIVSRPVPPTPDDFRVVAIMTVYNEEDVLAPSLMKLIDDGVGVYLIDNWSTDSSFEIAQSFEGRGLIGLEHFPAKPTPTFRLEPLLHRVEKIAAGMNADWLIHHDADERRTGPWGGIGLRDSLWRVQHSGFSAVDHTVMNFRPVDSNFEPGSDFEKHFRFFEFGRTRDMVVQVKAWKKVGQVDLASSSGHEARFVGRRVFPYKFLLKHYPVRSQAHGERKVLRDRIERWDPRERARGWHVHYDQVAEHQLFVRHPDELIEDRGAATRAQYLAELISGAGLADHSLPLWALRNRGSRALYRQSRRLLQGDGYERLRRFPLLRPAFIRRPLGRLRSILLEGRSSLRQG